MLKKVDYSLIQHAIYRGLAGGIFVRMAGRWFGAALVRFLPDGTRVLRRTDPEGFDFHEAFKGIEQLEEHG